MKTLKKLPLILLTLGLAMIVMVSCEDEFTQEDLATFQEAQLTEAIAALNNDGKFAGASIKVVTENNDPVEGATVSLTSETGVQSSTTDASGLAVFTNVFVGGNILEIDAENYIPMLAAANIGEITYEVINEQIAPIKVNTSAIFGLYPTGGETATISGIVTVDSILTNETREFVSGVDIVAAISAIGSSTSAGTGTFQNSDHFNISSYNFNSTKTDLGNATTDSEGKYTMTVPVLETGSSYTVRYPTVTFNQVLGISSRDGVDLGAVEIDTVLTSFGTDITTSTVTQYAGARITFNAPPEHGRGLSFDFGQISRTLGAVSTSGGTNIVSGVFDISAFQQPTQGSGNADGGGNGLDANTVGRITSRGGAYTSSPAVTVTGGNGVAGLASISLAVPAGGLTADATPNNFGGAANQVYTISYQRVSPDFAPSTAEITAGDFTDSTTINTGITLTVPSNAAGLVVQTAIDSVVSANISALNTGFDPNSPTALYSTGAASAGIIDGQGATSIFFISGTDTLTLTSGLGYVDALHLFATGSTVNSGWTSLGIDIAGDAAWETIQFGSRWTVVPNNSANTSGYQVLPEALTFFYSNVSASIANQTSIVGSANSVVTFNPVTLAFGAGQTIYSILEVRASDSTVQTRGSSLNYATSFFSSSAPTIEITDTDSETAAIVPGGLTALTLDGNGGFTGATIATANATFTSAGGNTVFNTVGNGYTGEFVATIIPGAPGLPGSGATIEFNTGAFVTAPAITGEFANSFGTPVITNPGTGYRRFVNLTGATSASGEVSFTLRPGEEVVHTFYYGTGARTETVQ